MSAIRKLIESLRMRSDVGVIDEKDSWLISISKGRDFVCEVTVAREVLEWHASVKHRREKKEMWSDWMDWLRRQHTRKAKIQYG